MTWNGKQTEGQGVDNAAALKADKDCSDFEYEYDMERDEEYREEADNRRSLEASGICDD